MAGRFDPDKVTLGELLDDEEGRALIEELAPEIPKHPMVGMAKRMPIKTLLSMAGGQVSAEDAAKFRERVAEL